MYYLFITLFLSIFLFSNCSSKKNITPEEAIYKYFKGIGEMHKQNEIFTIRYNPTYCDCPQFEVQLGELWFRVNLESSLAEENFYKFLQKAKERLAEGRVEKYKVKGKLNPTPGACESKALYFTLKLNEIL